MSEFDQERNELFLVTRATGAMCIGNEMQTVNGCEKAVTTQASRR